MYSRKNVLVKNVEFYDVSASSNINIYMYFFYKVIGYYELPFILIDFENILMQFIYLVTNLDVQEIQLTFSDI